uniref:Uncharacterized protein n=1 Tax=Plectus sambesii TaxID=2011161 RepID=A0A914VXU4_9BILA
MVGAPNNAFNNDINGGRNVTGLVNGENVTIVQGDLIVNRKDPPSPPPNTEDGHSKRISKTPPSSPTINPPATATRHKIMET